MVSWPRPCPLAPHLIRQCPSTPLTADVGTPAPAGHVSGPEPQPGRSHTSPKAGFPGRGPWARGAFRSALLQGETRLQEGPWGLSPRWVLRRPGALGARTLPASWLQTAVAGSGWALMGSPRARGPAPPGGALSAKQKGGFGPQHPAMRGHLLRAQARAQLQLKQASDEVPALCGRGPTAAASHPAPGALSYPQPTPVPANDAGILA